MYKGNGATREFPLPAGADGRTVVWDTGLGVHVLKEGEAYNVKDGNVVFSVAPPAGVTVAFAVLEATKPAAVCTVIYPDGRVVEISEDPHELLAAAKVERDEARGLFKAAIAESENMKILARQQAELAKETLAGRLARYAELVDETVKNAAALARDEVKDHLDKQILEVRNKHKAVMAAHAEIEHLARCAEEAANASATEAVRGVHECCARATEACEDIRRIRAEVLDMRDGARNAATNAAADVSRSFAAGADAVLEEVRSVKKMLDGEIRTLVEGAKKELDAGLREVRAQRTEVVRGIKHMNRIERFAIEKEDEMKAVVLRLAGKGSE